MMVRCDYTKCAENLALSVVLWLLSEAQVIHSFLLLLSALSLSFNLGSLQVYLPQFLLCLSSPIIVFQPNTVSFVLRVPEECLLSYVVLRFSYRGTSIKNPTVDDLLYSRHCSAWQCIDSILIKLLINNSY